MSSLIFLLFIFVSHSISLNTELDTLMLIKDSLDPENHVLLSWNNHSDPCSGTFEGVACNEQGLVTNISLQGKGLSGEIPSVIGKLKSLTGLYLHFNALNGILPKEIAGLTQLSDLYLNVNNLSGFIPHEIGNMSNLQVLQLCHNELSGSIPTELGKLKRLSVLALQYNHLSGAIPASLGELETLERLDLSFNTLLGPIPVTLANAPKLETLDIRNNSLSGSVPTDLKRLKEGFQYFNNHGLCGTGFANLDSCQIVSNSDPVRPEPYDPSNISTIEFPTTPEPKSKNCGNSGCRRRSDSSTIGLVFAVIGVVSVSAVTGLFLILRHRRLKQKIGNTVEISDNRISTDKIKEVYRKKASPLINLEYSSGWDPLSKDLGGYSQEFLQSFMFNLEEVDRATQCFSEMNLLAKNNISANYRGILRDGSIVVIKCIAKTSCKSDETEFLNGLKILTSLKHENLVRLRGFCCSKSRGECFLVYDFVSNGSLSMYLDVQRESAEVLEWSTRVSIIHGIAKGISYLHGKKGRKHSLVHQSISAEKVLLDSRLRKHSFGEENLNKIGTRVIVMVNIHIIADDLKRSNRDLVAFFHSISGGVDRGIIDHKHTTMFFALNTFSTANYATKIFILLRHIFSKNLDWWHNVPKFLKRGYNFAATLVTLLTVFQTCYAIIAYHHPN